METEKTDNHDTFPVITEWLWYSTVSPSTPLLTAPCPHLKSTIKIGNKEESCLITQWLERKRWLNATLIVGEKLAVPARILFASTSQDVCVRAF